MPVSETAELLFKFVNQGQAELDRAAASVEKITTGAAKANTSVQGLEKGLSDTTAAASGLSRSLASTIQSLNPLSAGVIGLGVAFGAAAKSAFDLVDAQGKSAQQTVNLAGRLGTTVGQAEQLQVAARLAGVSLGEMSEASRQLAVGLTDSTGAGKRTASALEDLKVRTRDVSGAQREGGKIFMEALQALRGVEDQTKRTALAAALFGEQGPRLVQVFAQGIDAAKALGAGLDEDVTKQLAKGQQEIEKTRIAFDLLLKSLAGKINPVIIPLVVALSGRGASAQSTLGGPSFPGASRSGPGFELESFLKEVVGNLNKFLGPSSDTAFVSAQALADRGSSAASTFRAGQLRTRDGLQNRLQQIRSEQSKLASSLASPDVFGAGREDLQRKFDALVKESEGVEKSLRAFGKNLTSINERAAALVTKYEKKDSTPYAAFQLQLAQDLAGIKGASPDLIRKIQQAAEGEGRFLQGQEIAKLQAGSRITRSIDLVRPNFGYDFMAAPEESKGQQEQLKALAEGLIESLKKREEITKRINTSEVEAAARLLELSGNEYEAAARIRDLKKATAQDAAESRQADLDYAVKVAEIEKRHLDEYKQTAGQVYRSLRQGGASGLQAFATGQFDIQGQKLFENVSGKIFQSAGGAFGKFGAASGLPQWLLDGTLFDPKNTQRPLDKNTTSLDQLRRSVDRLIGRLSGSGTGIGTSLYDIPLGSTFERASDWTNLLGSDLNGITGSKALGRVFGGSTTKALGNFIAGTGSILNGGLFSGIRGNDRSVTGPDGRTTTASALGLTSTAGRIGNVVGSAGALAAGGFGIYSGIKEGGARGATTAIGSALGLAALIPGPQQIFLAAAAGISGLVRGLFGDPKAEFDKRQTALLESRRFVGPESINRTYDYTTGKDVDYDWRGRVRTMTPTIQVNFQVQAIDMDSIERRAPDFAKAIGNLVTSGRSPEMTEGIHRITRGSWS